jgi:hypothetical protein
MTMGRPKKKGPLAMTYTRSLYGLAELIDGGPVTAAEAVTAESDYSRLANEAHALRLENQRLRDVIGTINGALEALNLRGM